MISAFKNSQTVLTHLTKKQKLLNILDYAIIHKKQYEVFYNEKNIKYFTFSWLY